MLLPPSIQSRIDATRIAVGALNLFGRQLLRELIARTPRKNVFISPLGVFLALHMTENGSAGTTRAAMRKVLGLPDLDASVLNASSEALQSWLKSHHESTLTIANALWADRHLPLDPEFVKLCESRFSARAAQLDFQDPQAAEEINEWVKAATMGRIGNLVTPETIAQAAVLLTNAIYFADLWRIRFPLSQTQSETFHLTGGGVKTVPMMHQARLSGAYRAGARFDGAVLDYRESSIFFCALLPQAGNTPGDVLESLDVSRLTAGTSEFDLELKLPRFSIDCPASLAAPLARMGMEVAFQYPQADFSPMGSRLFCISDVIHKARLEVDEEGTVAAAATVVTVRVGAARPRPRPMKTLVFDRPFAVLIGESLTGAILFAGTIEEP